MKYIIIFILLAAFIFYQVAFQHLAVINTQHGDVYLADRFVDVRKCLVRTNTLEEMIALNCGKLISESEPKNSITTYKHPLRNWNVSSSKDFEVKCKDGFCKNEILSFHNDVKIIPTKLVAITTLNEPAGRLKEYTTTTIAEAMPDGTTHIFVSLKIKYEGVFPYWVNERVIREVKESAVKGVKKNLAGLQSHIEQNKGKQFTIKMR